MTTPQPLSGVAASGDLSSVRHLRRLTAVVPGANRTTAANAVPRPRFRWQTRLLLPAVLLIGFAATLGYTARDALVPPTPVKVTPVVLADAGGANDQPAGTVVVQAPGWMEPDPYAVLVTALADGVVREVLVLEGQQVQKGQVVAWLIDDDAKLALARAEAELSLRQAALSAAESHWQNPIERTRAVAATAGRAAQNKAELRMLESEVAAAAAKAAEAGYESERLSTAQEGRAASALEAVVAQQRKAAADATLEATRRRKEVLQQQLAQAEAELIAAQENQRLRIEEAQQLAEAKAAVDFARTARDEAKLRLDRMAVRSPVDGVVLSRHVEPGAKLMLSMDQPLSSVVVKLYDPKKLQVRVDVPLADAAKVSIGQSAEVTVAKLPDRVFRGKVTRVVHEADVQKNTQQFKVQILDPSPELAPEMLARAKFLAVAPADSAAVQASTAVFAPVSLLSRQGESAEATVWVVDPSRMVATQRTVQLGTAVRDGWIAVASGLPAGSQIIAQPTGLTEGQKVRIEGETESPEQGQRMSPTHQEARNGVH